MKRDRSIQHPKRNGSTVKSDQFPQSFANSRFVERCQANSSASATPTDKYSMEPTKQLPEASASPLVQPYETAADTRMIARAIRERWPVSDDMKVLIMKRLAVIVGKAGVTVHSGEDSYVAEAPADANAVRAASVVVQMTAQNQADEHLADKNERLDAGKATERYDGVTINIPGLKG